MKTNFFTMAAVVLICCTTLTKASAQANRQPSKAILSFVNASEDDAEENLTTGKTTVSSTDLKLNSTEKDKQVIGIRFTNLNIPQGAIISSARLIYNVDELKDGWNELTVSAENADHAPAFKAVNNNISARVKTEVSIKLDDNSVWVNINGSFTSPNIAPVIQEIVNRPGWEEMNAIALLLEGSGESTAIAYDGNPNLPPMLIVNYSENQNAFTNVLILTNDDKINQSSTNPQENGIRY
ncbi:MAG: hypothetical protein R2753_01515 [Chitinophagales bacterium]